MDTVPFVPKIFATDALLMPDLTLLNSDFVTQPFDRYSTGIPEAAEMAVALKEAVVMRVATMMARGCMTYPDRGTVME